MKKKGTTFLVILLLIAVPFYGFCQESGISEESSRESSQQSSEESSRQSTEESSEDSSEESSRQSTENSSEETTDESSGASSDVEISANPWVIVGAVVVIGLTAAGIYMVQTSKVREAEVLGLQDQIYLAEGTDLDQIKEYFGLEYTEIAECNDEIMAQGMEINSAKDAA
ncbi:MAG: hypothetical protein JXB03_08460, partial [Spirochaetales bacterium]|nr:hypothetical protein [Spirochaetales bacterium]